MDFKLEHIAVPVSDVDRAKAFCTDNAGFHPTTTTSSTTASASCS